MDLIERYLYAVKGHLPLKLQEDVVTELADDLRSRVEDREAELGRPVTEGEVAAILKGLGRPMVLASRYGTRQTLVGPALLPYYWKVLKVSLGIALLVHAIVAVVLLVAGRTPGESLRGLVTFPFVAAPTLVGWMTLVFMVLERQVTNPAAVDSWNPATLPAVPRDGQAPSRVPIVGELVMLGAVMAWWLLVPAHPVLLLGPAAAFLEPGPGWDATYLPVAALMGLGIAAHVAALVKPALRLPGRLAAHVLALAGIALIASTGDLLVPSIAGRTPESLARLTGIIDKGVKLAAGVGALITLIEMGRDLWRLRQARQPRLAAAGASTPPESPR